jgi:hypothetical protein
MPNCPFCGNAWGTGEQCQSCGVPRTADPVRSVTENILGPVEQLFLLNPVNRGVAMGYSRWAGGAVEQRESSWQLGIYILVGGVFGLLFLSVFVCAAASTGSWIFLLFGLALFAGAAALVINLILKTRKNGMINKRFAQAEGTLIPGEITASRVRYIGSTKNHNRHPRIGIEYSFRAPDGQVLSGTGISRFPPVDRNMLPPSGTRVAVLYLDERYFKAL